MAPHAAALPARSSGLRPAVLPFPFIYCTLCAPGLWCEGLHPLWHCVA